MIKATDIPSNKQYRLSRAQAPSCLLKDGDKSNDLTLVDLDIKQGKIDAVYDHYSAPSGENPVVDLNHRQLWPGFIDVHTHLDKAHIWPRTENPDGTFYGALHSVESDREQYWTAEELSARMDFALRCAYAYGTVALRTHLDSRPPQHNISWPVFAALRNNWAGRIDLQATSLVSIDAMVMPFAQEIADLVADSGGVLGAVTYMTEDLEQTLELTFKLAMERGLDLDFHVDESLDPQAASLSNIAAIALRLNFPGKIIVGHCCSLATQNETQVNEVLAAVRAAGIHVVSLPMCNLYLQDRVAGRTPRQRGVTLLHEIQNRGIPLAIASDNVRDPFYAYGDLDMLEVFTQAVRIAHLDRPVTPWPRCITGLPAAMMGLDAGEIRAGAKADLVICEGRAFSEVLSRPQHRRIVLRAGKPIDTNPPDYRELDFLLK